MKKLCTVLLAVLCCVLPLCLTSYAAPVPSDGELTYYELDGEVIVSDELPALRADIRFKYFDTLTSRMVESGGLSTCTGTALVDRNYTYTMVCAIKRSSDGKSWSNVKSWPLTQSGVRSIDMENQYYLTSGFQHRLDVTLTVYDGSTKLESATRSSNIVYY